MTTGGSTMLRRVRRATIAAATMAVAATMTAGPAFAESRTVNDAKRDVWALKFKAPEDGFKKAGSVLNADLRKVKVVHSRSTIKITATYANMAKRKGVFGVTTALRLPGDGRVTIDVGSVGKKGKRQTYLADETGEITCSRIKSSLAFKRDQISVTVPRSCIGRPEWIKHITNSFQTDGPNDDRFHVDAAGSKRANKSSFSGRLAAG